MSLSRKLPWFCLALLGFLSLPALTGCGAARKEAASRPEKAATSTPAPSDTAGLDPASVPENQAIALAGSQPAGSTSPTMPKSAMDPPAAALNTTAAETASPHFAVSPAPPAASAATTGGQPQVPAPRVVAPMTRTRAPQSASGVLPDSTPLAAELAPAAPSDDAMPPGVIMPRAPALPETPLPPAAAAAETTPPEVAGATAAHLRRPVAEDRGQFQAVTVFYGTDRNSLVVSGQPDQPHRLWMYGAGVCILLFGLLALLAMAGSRKKALVGLSVVSLLAGAVMATMGSIAWLQSGRAVAGPRLEYGNGRGTFVMGTCEVSIPRGHQVAELEAPSVFKLDFVEDPSRHVVLLDVAEKDSKAFFSELRDRVDQSEAKDAFVFVHGFNVTFEDAARRTAQLAYDLKFQGAPIFYSWPSQGGLFQYAVDETNVVWTVPHLQQFLKEIAGRSGARSVHLIAHSMGNRALTSALRELSLERPAAPPLFHEVVLTAPDIDAEIFRRDIAPAIITTARRVTLYASSNDEALVVSKQVHGYPRAGETGEGLVVIPGIETIDVSAVDTSLLGHSYYGDNATVITDMIDLVRNSKSAQQRSWLVAARLHDLFYWVFLADPPAIGATPASTPSRY